MFGQTFDPHDLVIVGLLVVLEGVLSIDNALVLGLLAKRLPKQLRGRALTYGLVGAFVFRVIAIFTAAWLLEWRFVKLLGGAYLIYVAGKPFFFDSRENPHEHVAVGSDGTPVKIDDRTGAEVPPRPAPRHVGFWSTVVVIELTDLAFAVDSILAAIALVGSAPKDHPEHLAHPKLWVVVTGGMLGVILMRFAAVVFIRLLEKFPRFETSAYLLVTVIGLKLVADWAFNSKAYELAHPEHPHRVDFHDF